MIQTPSLDQIKANEKSNRPSGNRTVTQDLRQRILNGDWEPGSVIPSRRQLAAEYGVSPATMERAIVPLLADGTLRANDRSGTYVAESKQATNPPNSSGMLDGIRPTPRVGDSVRISRQGPVAIVATLYAPDSEHSSQNDFWIREIVAGMENELAEHGRHTIFVNRMPRHASDILPLEESLAQAVANESLSGLALVAFDLEPAEVENTYSLLSQYRFPIVSVVAEALSLPVPHVMLDNHRAGFQAAQYLLEQGYRQLTVLLPERASWAEERLGGVYAAVSRARQAQESVTVLRGKDRPWNYNNHPRDVASHSIEQAFRDGWTPNGPIICATDMVAMALIPLLTAKGYAIGSQIPVLGFDDHEFSRDFGLTTLRPPTRAMGKEAARLLLEGEENRLNGCQVRLCSKLIPRRSTLVNAHASQVSSLNLASPQLKPDV